MPSPVPPAASGKRESWNFTQAWSQIQQSFSNTQFAFSQPLGASSGFPRMFGGQTDDPDDGRFRRDFIEIAPVGHGQFSTVYRATSKVDLHQYAIKVQTRGPPGGDPKTSVHEAIVLADVVAKGSCDHIVRYFSSWIEEGALHIQTELCDSSLRSLMDARMEASAGGDRRFSEPELVRLFRHVSSGLEELHRLGFAHLDVKPDNILVAGECRSPLQAYYKIADFGLAVPATTARDDLTEGDCRYVARELLQGHNFDLQKADVFAMGLVVYEAGTLPEPMPRNGDLWQKLRNDFDVSKLPAYSDGLLSLLRSVVHPEHARRPCCAEICQHQSIKEESDEVKALRALLAKAEAELAQHRLLAEPLATEAVVKPQTSTLVCAPLGG